GGEGMSSVAIAVNRSLSERSAIRQFSPCRLAASNHVLPVNQERLAVDLDPAALPEVADQVPVDGRFVGIASFGVTGAHGHVDGAADLFVEQDVAGEASHVEIGAEGEFAQDAGTLVGVEGLAQVILAFGGAGVDDLAVDKAETDVDDLATAEGDRVGEADVAV